MKIKSLGYIGIAAPDPAQWLAFATGIVGAMPARALPGESWGMPADPANPGPASGGRGIAADGSAYLKLDDWQWRVAVHPAPSRRGIAYLGLEVHDRRALEQAVAELEKAGAPAELARDADAASRAVTALARTRDPAGNVLELFFGPTMDFNFASPQPGTRFVTGDLGFGHVNLFVADMAANFGFYTAVLGFELSDYIRFGGDASVQFLRCNARHHSIALVDVGGVDGLHHVLFELPDVDTVGRTLDRAMRAGSTITSTLGRHRNDNMLSFYMAGPSGFDVEVGCEGLLVDANWTAREFCEGDVWGHHGLTAEAITEAAGRTTG